MSPSLSGLRVLVVDDDQDSVDVTRAILEHQGAVVETAADAQSALDAIPTRRPDVLLVDLAMPVHDGYWLMQQVRLLPPEQGGLVSSAAFTAHADTATREQVLKAGFQLHLTKPVEPQHLTQVVWVLGRQRVENGL